MCEFGQSRPRAIFRKEDLSRLGLTSGIVVVVRQRFAMRNTALRTLGLVLLGALCTLIKCSGGSEEAGQMHVTATDVVGVYRSGSEHLELQTNGTYVQDDISDSPPLHYSGRWRMLSHFLDGCEVVLLNAAVVPPTNLDDPQPYLTYADLPMYGHGSFGKVALARNEIADWYYERSQ
jgi:hypothetical protein